MSRNPDGDDQDAGSGTDVPLNEALDDLEDILGPRGKSTSGRNVAPDDRGSHPASRPEGPADGEAPADATLGGAPHARAEHARDALDGTWDRALYRMTAERLASELEIIMNARLEAALAHVGEDLRRELRNHIEIVLPEIVSTLADDDLPPRYE